eukprot:XP_001696323.1 predicted protein [Chlamydomonas reinhardtii]
MRGVGLLLWAEYDVNLTPLDLAASYTHNGVGHQSDGEGRPLPLEQECIEVDIFDGEGRLSDVWMFRDAFEFEKHLIRWHLPVVPVAEQTATALKGFSTCDVRHVRNAASSTSSEASPVFRHPGELDLSLREYMVVLEKPVGLTLAPDPRTGQVGDVVQSVSAVFGDDMWAAADIRRVRWAINSRMGDVRLFLEQFRRLGHGGATTSWYSSGKVSFHRNTVEAALAAETALGGAPVDTALLEAGTAALLAGGRERCSRVVLTWKYGGLSAYVAGDVVASWAARVPMVRCRSPLGCKGDTHPGHFFLEVTGLPPGAYFYKYIVDGTWAVDSLSNKSTAGRGVVMCRAPAPGPL